MTTAAERSLTVACWAGLGNRLRVLLSGLTVAVASDRRFTMLWPRTRDCAASFTDLFVNDWPVEEASLTAVKDLPPYLGYYCPPLPDALTSAAPHLALLTPHSLLEPARSPRHAALLPKCAALLAALEPTPLLADQIAAFKAAHFRLRMIGVHLRRGDFLFYGAGASDNFASSRRAVEVLLRQWSDAGIFLCSDDGAGDPYQARRAVTGVHAAYRQHFGERVVWRTPSSLDRSQPAATQDALVDLWLLRATDGFVGTPDSSFSEMAVFGRSVPTRWAEPDHWRYRLAAGLLHAAGIAWLLRQQGRRRFGRELSLPRLLHYYRSRLLRCKTTNDARGWQLHELPSAVKIGYNASGSDSLHYRQTGGRATAKPLS